MKQQLVRLVFPHGSTRRVIRGPARGMRFVVEPGIGFTYAVGNDLAAPRHFRDWVKPGMTVYDVGANKGQTALILAALVGPAGRVVALEPAPHEFASFARNVELNRLSWVRPVQAAAAAAAGELLFTYQPDQPTQGKFLDLARAAGGSGANDGAFLVRTLALDSLLDEEPPPDVIKIDVEGAAAGALRGASRILSEFSPMIYVEMHSTEERLAVVEEILARGYVARDSDGNVVTDPVHGSQLPLWCYKPSDRRAFQPRPPLIR